MRCPFCGNDDSQVKDSRPTEDAGAIRRRRQCPACGGRFTTFERVQLRELTIVKKSGKREVFDRDKLARSIEIACRKRPIEADRIERMVNGVVRRLESTGDSEIEVGKVGEMVMEGLQTLDPVAYIRFASVYRDFREPRDFETFVGSLTENLGPAIGAAPRGSNGSQPAAPTAVQRQPGLPLPEVEAKR